MPLDDIEKLYDHENAIEAAVFAALKPYDLPIATRLTPRSSRPSVMIKVEVGAETGNRHIMADGSLRPQAWRGQLVFLILTEPPAENTDPVTACDPHAELRARLRYLVAGIMPVVNASMQTHSLNGISDARSDTRLRIEDGIEATTLAYDIHFNIRTDAWPTA